MDFASKGETDVYFYLVDKGFDQNVAKILEGIITLGLNQALSLVSS